MPGIPVLYRIPKLEGEVLIKAPITLPNQVIKVIEYNMWSSNTEPIFSIFARGEEILNNAFAGYLLRNLAITVQFGCVIILL